VLCAVCEGRRRAVDEQLAREEADRLQRINAATPPRRREDPEYETVWNGGGGLSSYAQQTGLRHGH
jgi:hypothetical protein